AQERERQRLAKIEAEKKAKRIAQEKANAKVEKKQSKQTVDKNVEQVSKPKSSGKELGTYEATFYDAMCDSGCTGQTASGYSVKNTIYYQGMRIVAAPKSIPFYTKLRITFSDGSQMTAIVLDRGGAIKSGKLDILVSSRQEALNFGRQQVKVEIIS